ncbi:MAG TPA: YciI family protein [Verrucomicrobiae bacterium]|nr:YciI family protein [Verrucomicrobiae bacterium]
MRYLCLIYHDETAWSNLPKDEAERTMAEYRALREETTQSGRFLDGNRLHLADSATVVRVRNGKLMTTDGPFAETKEQLGGYFLFEARDLNEAIQLASRIPGARTGCVEVRPVAEPQAMA